MQQMLPILFMLAMIPESQKNLENLHALIMATKDSVENIRNGVETFHATMMPLMRAFSREQTEKTGPTPSSGGRI